MRLFGSLVLALCAACAAAQPYPAKPVRLVVPFPAGGIADIYGRLIGARSMATTPDNRTAFVNIQHPGETPGDRSNPDNPSAFSNWPDYAPNGRPRSATVVIRRKDGGIVGT